MKSKPVASAVKSGRVSLLARTGRAAGERLAADTTTTEQDAVAFEEERSRVGTEPRAAPPRVGTGGGHNKPPPSADGGGAGGNSDTDTLARRACDGEAQNAPFCPSHENIPTAVLNGVRNISGTLSNPPMKFLV